MALTEGAMENLLIASSGRTSGEKLRHPCGANPVPRPLPHLDNPETEVYHRENTWSRAANMADKLKITYEFKLSDGAEKKFDIVLDKERLSLVKENR